MNTKTKTHFSLSHRTPDEEIGKKCIGKSKGGRTLKKMLTRNLREYARFIVNLNFENSEAH